MRADRNRRLDAETAERLIAGDRVEPHQLVNLLSWTAGPAHEDELVGEEAATLAFRSARIHDVPARHRRRRPARRWARLVSVKAAALGFALAITGVAVAAGTGVLPSPLHVPQPVLPATSTVDGSHRPGSTTGTASSTSALPSQIQGLCNAFLKQLEAAGKLENQGDTPQAKKTKKGAKLAQRLEMTAFSALAEAAGSADRVTEFCQTHLPQGKSGEAPDTGQNNENPATPTPSSSTGPPGAPARTPPPHPTPNPPTPTHTAGPANASPPVRR